MKSIVDKQTQLKRELAVLQQLIRSMSPNVELSAGERREEEL